MKRLSFSYRTLRLEKDVIDVARSVQIFYDSVVSVQVLNADYDERLLNEHNILC